MKKVAIIMGSDSDWPVVKGACTVLKDFGVPFEAHILSAHRTPEAAAAFAKSARANGYGVILCAAGMAAHLAGAAAILLNWGVLNANYPYLNTPVLKSIFVRGAQRNPALTYPNREFGYGTLNLYEAFLHLRNL